MSGLKPLAAMLLPLLLAACAQQPSVPNDTAALQTASNDPIIIHDGQASYLIQRRHIAKPGDVYDVQCVSELDININASDPDPKKPPLVKDEVKSYTLAGRMEVTAADEHGNQTACAFTISACTGPHTEELIAPKQVIDITHTPQGVKYVLHGGGKLSQDALHALSSLRINEDASGLLESDPPSQDLSRSVGDTWPNHITPGNSQSHAGESGAESTEMRGQTAIKAPEIFHDIKVLRVERSLSGKVKMHDLPWGITVDQSDMKIDQSVLIAVDQSLPPIESDMALEMRVSLKGSVLFVPIKMTTTTIMHQKQTITPIPKEIPAATKP